MLDPYIAQLESDVSVTYFMLSLPMAPVKVKLDDKPPKKRGDQEHKQGDQMTKLRSARRRVKVAAKARTSESQFQQH